MSKDKWNDEEIGRWLKSVPKPEDKRSRDEVLARLKADPRLRAQRPSRSRKWIPAGVAAAAFLAAGILIPSLMDGGGELSVSDSASEHADDAAQTASESAAPQGEDSIEQTETASDEEIGLRSAESGEQAGLLGAAVYPGAAEGFVPFRIGLVDAATVVPVTYLIPEAVVAKDFGDVSPGDAELYNHYAPQIDEEALGFDDYHPYEGTVSTDGDGLTLTLYGSHPYDLASAAITTFTESVQETFRNEETVLLRDEGGTPAEFEQVGEFPEIPVESEGAVYFAYEKSDGTTVLAPDRHLEPADAAEAIELMKGRTTGLFEPLIPDEADLIVELPADGDVMTIRFEEPFDFSRMEEQEATRMIDGIVLTVAQHHLRVRLENAVNPPAGYQLEEALPIPAGPNGIYLSIAGQ